MSGRNLRRGLALLFLVACTATVLFASEGVSIATASNRRLEVVSGEPTIVGFRIVNKQDFAVRLVPHLEIPDRWRVLNTPSVLDLDSGAWKVILIAVVAPPDTSAGEYEVCMKVIAEGAKDVLGEATASVHVPITLGVELYCVSSSLNALAGETFESTFILSNSSNVAHHFDVEVNGSIGSVSIDRSGVDLRAGDSKKLVVFTEVPQDLPRESVAKTVLTVTAADFPELQAEATSSVNVYPRSGGGNVWHRYPVSIRWVSTYDAANASNPFEHQPSISGRGTLDDEGKHRLEFSAKPPPFPDSPYEIGGGEYSLRYQNEHLNIAVGDRNFFTSPLISGSENGRGIEGSITFNDLTAGGYYFDDGFGSYLRFEPDDLNRIDIGLSSSDSEGSGIAAGADGFLRIYDTANVKFEVASGLRSTSDYAYLVAVEGKEPFFSYDLALKRAAPEFSGAIPDFEWVSGSGSVRLAPDLKLSGGYQRERHNLELNAASCSALASDKADLSVVWNPITGMEVHGGWRLSQERDLLDGADSLFRQQNTDASWMWTTDDLRISAIVDLVSVWNRGGADIYSYEEISLAADYKPERNIDIGAQFRINSGATSPGFDDANYAVTIRGAYAWSDRSSIRLSVLKSSHMQSIYQDYTSLNLALRLGFPGNAKLSLGGGATFPRDPSADDTYHATLTYELPIDIPVSRRSDVGAVRGVVVHNESGEGLPEVIVTIGEKTVATDGRGEFLVPVVPIGEWYLNLNTTRLRSDLIPVLTMPVPVIVELHKESEIRIEMTRPAAISGIVVTHEIDRSRLRLFSDDPAEYTRNGGLGGAVIEAVGPQGARRTVSRDDGTFSMDALPPGIWTVTILPENLPEGSVVRESSFELNIAPGETAEVMFQIMPIVRDIQFQNQGEILEIE